MSLLCLLYFDAREMPKEEAESMRHGAWSEVSKARQATKARKGKTTEDRGQKTEYNLLLTPDTSCRAVSDQDRNCLLI